MVKFFYLANYSGFNDPTRFLFFSLEGQIEERLFPEHVAPTPYALETFLQTVVTSQYLQEKDFKSNDFQVSLALSRLFRIMIFFLKNKIF